MAAQDAELKLKVSLDLAFFRQQLSGLGAAAAGTPLQLRVQFDRRGVQNELNALSANIRRRNYTLNVNTNLKAEIENASKLAKALDELGRSRSAAQKGINQQLGLGQLLQGPQSGGLGVKDVAKLYRAAAKAGILSYNKEIARTKASMVAALESAGVDSVKGLLNGLTSGNDQLRNAAALLGESLIKTVKGVLGIASPSREFKKIGQNVGEGLQQGMMSSVDKAFDAVEGLMRARMKVLDTIARGMFRIAGVDPAAIRAEAMQRRALPGVNFPATVPPRNVPIGPSGTGRALPPGAIPSALPGTAFGGQKYLPTALSDELKQILRGAAFAFVDSLKQQVRSTRVGLAATQQPLLGPGRVAGLLPAAVGRAPSVYSTAGETQAELFARREREARMRSALRGVDVMQEGGGTGRPAAPYSYAYRSARPTNAIVPYAAGGALVAQPSIGGGGMQPPSGGGGGAFGGAGGFGRAMGGLGNLPGAGTIRELGSEFGFATKQVLLFGQAYKLLAFIQDFPGQVAGAVSQLQSFRNTLLSVTGSASAAADANEFILAAVEKYSIPLQSARDGFTKLFASMEPAGFAAGEIQNLFLGISKAAATYGLSADKVDRVNYAFAQMASKGQVMSEELKGQLGDVLPGAMGIFAEAAGFKGPDAIQKFGKALEDGVYKGSKMRELLRNVADGMNKEFGPGAEGAAKTFQGAMNRMQTATQKLYESFEPAAIGVLNTVAVPLVNTLKNLTDGVNAYFSGQQAATPAAQGFADVLKTLVPTLSGIGENLKYVFQQVSILVQGFGAVALQVARLLALPIVRYLAGTYVQVLLLTTAFRALATSGIGAALVAIVQFIGRGVVFGQVMLGMRVATQQTTVAMTQFGTTVQTVMIKSVIGVALVAIGALISRLVELQNAMASVSGQSKAMGDAAKASAKMGDVAGVKEAIGNMEDRVQTYQRIKGELDKTIKQDAAGSSFYREIPSALAKDLMSLGLIVENSMRKTGAGYKVKIGDLRDAYGLAAKNVSEFNDEINKSQGLVGKAEQQNRKLKEQGTAGLDMAAGDSKGAAKALEDARKLADDKAKYEADMAKKSNLQALELDEMAFEHWKKLQDEKYNILVAGENSWLSQAIKFQKELQDVEISRIETVRKAREATAKAEIEAGAKSYIAGAGGGAGGGAAMFGATGRVFNAPGWVHGHFQNMNREALVSDTVDVVMKLLSQGVSPELGSGAKFSSGMSQDQVTSLVRKGIASHKSYASGVGAIDVFVPQGTKVPVPLSGVGNLGGAAGIAGMLPGGTQLMHLAPGSQSGGAAAAGGMPASRQRAELKKDYNAALAAQEALNKKEQENLAVQYKNVEVRARIAALIKQQVAEITPVEEQKLENGLIKEKISLISSGAFGAALDTEEKIAQATAKATLNIGIAKSKIEENTRLAKEQKWTNEQLTEENQKQLDYISQQEKALAEYIPLLRERLALEQGAAEAELRGQIQRATPLGGMGLAAGFIGAAADRYTEAIGRGASEQDAARFAELQNQLTLLETRNEAIQQSILGIGDAFGQAMTTGVASLVTGTASAKEVFGDFLKSVGQALLDAAGKMIATYIAIGIARMFAGLGGGGQSVEAPQVNIGPTGPTIGGFAAAAEGAFWSGGFAPVKKFAAGGVVNGPTLGLVGEGGESEYIIPSSKMGAAMARYAAGARGSAVIPGRGASGGSGGVSNAAGASIDVRYTVERINSVDYVTADQFQQGMRQATVQGAELGERRALSRLQNSPSARRRVGV
jgi:tape measure domain-containing protein